MLKRILYIINMGFFDLKLIIIIALTIICYFIYKELLHINKKINYMYGRVITLENNYQISNGDMPLNIEKELNELEDIDNLDKKITKQLTNKNNYQKYVEKVVNQQENSGKDPQTELNVESNIVFDPNIESNIIIDQKIQSELDKLNDEYVTIQNELKNLPQDISEDFNIVFNQISMVPMNIPFNLNTILNHNNKQFEIMPEIKEVSDESFSDKLNFEEYALSQIEKNNNSETLINEKLSETSTEKSGKSSETSKKSSEKSNKLSERSKKSSEKSNKLSETSKKSSEKSNKLSETSKKSSQKSNKLSESSKKISQKSSKELDNDTISSETSQSKVTTPLEEFSNDNTNDENNEKKDKNENIETTLQINESKLENILKNLNKYKLPELQDIAIEYKLGLQINGKNKNKNQLLNDIKNFILNKNI